VASKEFEDLLRLVRDAHYFNGFTLVDQTRDLAEIDPSKSVVLHLLADVIEGLYIALLEYQEKYGSLD